jgi:hypothetical protein
MILTCSSRFIAAFFFALLASESTVSAYKVFLGKMNYKLAVAVGASMLILNPDLASAQVDCNRNCLQNCTKVAPGSVEYCKSSCTEYCEQTDRLESTISSHFHQSCVYFFSVPPSVQARRSFRQRRRNERRNRIIWREHRWDSGLWRR